MIPRADLAAAVRRLFWGYFLLSLDINFSLDTVFTLPLLPDAAGWYLLWRGTMALTSQRSSLGLLGSLCVSLSVYSLLQFLPALEAMVPGWLDLLMAMVTLYTHFQLLTDVAGVAEEVLPGSLYPSRLRTARTLIVLIHTLLYCYDLLLLFSQSFFLSLVLVVAGFLAYLFVMILLRGLSRALAAPPQAPAL